MSKKKVKPATSFEMVTNDAPKDSVLPRIINETEVLTKAVMALKSFQCTCQRTYPYSGVGKVMCPRCRVIVLWEELNEGESETQKLFDLKVP